MTRRFVIVTGAASGIGKATALHLASHGIMVFAGDVDRETLAELKGPNILPFSLDITSEQSIQEAKDLILQTSDALDGLVNNAGIFDQFPLVEVDNKRFDKLINTNFLGAHKMIHAFFPLLFKKKGRIVNLSSESTLSLMPMQAYSMTKGLLEVYSDVLHQELALLNMHVAVIRPGAHKTPLIDKTFHILDEVDQNSVYRNHLENIKKSGHKILLQTKNDPVAVAKAVFKALTDPKPRPFYHVNVSSRFRILKFLPDRVRKMIIKKLLERKQ